MLNFVLMRSAFCRGVIRDYYNCRLILIVVNSIQNQRHYNTPQILHELVAWSKSEKWVCP